MDESSLSEHEQRILEEIERNLEAEDPAFARAVLTPKSPSSNRTRLGILAVVTGMVLLMGYFVHTVFGVAGFLVMLGGVYLIGTSMRERASDPRLGAVIKRAEGKLRRCKDG